MEQFNPEEGHRRSAPTNQIALTVKLIVIFCLIGAVLYYLDRYVS